MEISLNSDKNINIYKQFRLPRAMNWDSPLENMLRAHGRLEPFAEDVPLDHPLRDYVVLSDDPTRKHLVLVTGAPGTGKSALCQGTVYDDGTYAEGLRDLDNTVVLDKDNFGQAISGLADQKRERQAKYHLLEFTATKFLQGQRPTVDSLLAEANKFTSEGNAELIAKRISRRLIGDVEDPRYVVIDATYAQELNQESTATKLAKRYDVIAQTTGALQTRVRTICPCVDQIARIVERGRKCDLEKLHNWEQWAYVDEPQDIALDIFPTLYLISSGYESNPDGYFYWTEVNLPVTDEYLAMNIKKMKHNIANPNNKRMVA